MKIRDLMHELAKYDLDAEAFIFDNETCDGPFEVQAAGPCGCDEPLACALHFNSAELQEQMREHRGRPIIEFDDSSQVLIVEGTRYSYDFFRQLGQGPANVGTIFRIEEKDAETKDVVLSRPSKAELFKWATEAREDGSRVDFETAGEMHGIVKDVLCLD